TRHPAPAAVRGAGPGGAGGHRVPGDAPRRGYGHAAPPGPGPPRGSHRRGSAPRAAGLHAPPAVLHGVRGRGLPASPPAPGALPGGSVDGADGNAGIGWAGPDAAEWGRRLDAPAELARTLVCAAVRETFEECGVLLAGPDAGTVLARTEDEGWEDDRRQVLAG